MLRHGLEPQSPDYKTGIIAFILAEHDLVPRARIELATTGYQPIVIPFNYPGIWWMRLESNQQCLSGGGFTVHWGYQFSYTSKLTD